VQAKGLTICRRTRRFLQRSLQHRLRAACKYKESIMASNQGNKQSSGTKNRGFASMDPQRQREIASEGGKAAHQKGTAHEFTSEEARRAGSMSHGNRQSAESRTATKSTTSATPAGNKQGGSRGPGSGSKSG
jgi:general stress protein YciG